MIVWSLLVQIICGVMPWQMMPIIVLNSADSGRRLVSFSAKMPSILKSGPRRSSSLP